MKSIVLLLIATLASNSYAGDFCEGNQTGRWAPDSSENRLIEAWYCDLNAHVGGLTFGIGHAVNIMAGSGELSCEAVDVYGEPTACYRENIDMAFLGGGIGLGFSVVSSLDVHSIGIKLVDLDPENLIGLRFGALADVSLHVLRDRIGAGASLSFSTASGVLADVQLSRARGLGLYAGAHISGFVMHEQGYLDRKDPAVFSPENFVSHRAESIERANDEHPELRNYGVPVYSSDRELKGKTLNDFINRGLEKARNICATSSLKAIYVATDCKDDQSCQSIYVRAVCN